MATVPNSVAQEALGLSDEFWCAWNDHEDYLFRLCVGWMNRNVAEAEEVMSDAMMKALDAWQKSDTEISHPRAWLAKIIRNQCTDVHRKRKRSKLVKNGQDVDPSRYRFRTTPLALDTTWMRPGTLPCPWPRAKDTRRSCESSSRGRISTWTADRAARRSTVPSPHPPSSPL